MQIYLVGGAVRDRLLGRPVAERDWVVVGATAQQMLDLGYRQVGRDFPVFLHPQTKEEYALARTERKSGPGYRGFEVHASPEITLEQDLARRDLTINAMAEAADGRLIDPFHGEQDLHQRLLRHVSPAFAEDPVRVLRIARFAARYADLGFRVADETFTLLVEMVRNGEVDALVPERVWQELTKALGEAQPQAFFQVLRECGALARVFPEIDALFGVPQPAQWHPEIDTGVHTLMVLEQAARLSDDCCVRFAALTHDLGKAVTPREQWPRHFGHEGRGARLVERLCNRLHAPKRYRELAVVVARHHLHCHKLAELKSSTIVDLLGNLGALRDPERVESFVLACEADARGRLGLEDNPYPQAGLLRRLAAAVAQVSPQPFVERGLEGERMAQALRKARIDAVEACRGEAQGA
jgi:tRNA nucleotidyltransferase (CCA-adding enzyme)